ELELSVLFAIVNKTAQDLLDIEELDDEIISLDSLILYHEGKKTVAQAELTDIVDNKPDYDALVTALENDLVVLEAELDAFEVTKENRTTKVTNNIGNVEDSYTAEIDLKESELESLIEELDEKAAEFKAHNDLVVLYQLMIDLYSDLFGHN
ncbi:hypothetical protein N9W79_02605, partial [bacterium]|nr:hypothetical protein [bacterium]